MIRRRGEKDYRYSVVFKDNSAGCQTFVRFNTKKEAEKFISSDEIQIRLKRHLEKSVVRSFFREKGLAFYDHFH